MDLTTAQWLQAGAAAFLVGFAKTGVTGLGILIVPLMASVFPARKSVGALLPMLLFADLFAVTYFRRHARWPLLLRLLPWVAPGMAVGYVALRNVTNAQLAPMLGSLVLILIALNALKARLGTRLEERLPRQLWFSALMGFLAGFATTIGNVAGPIMSVYLISMGLKKRQFMGTGAWYYLIVNALKVPLNSSLGLITAASLEFDLRCAPVIALGAGTGLLVFERIPQTWFNRAILALAAVAALRLVLFS